MAIAKRPGVMEKEHLGLKVLIKSKSGKEGTTAGDDSDLYDEDDLHPNTVMLSNEVKRLGFLVDRKVPL
jgi:hypothetical protein